MSEYKDTKCYKGWSNGDCCCNCEHRVKIMKHPSNKGIAKGSISEVMGYGCKCPLEDGSMKGSVVFSDWKHGYCELYWRKEE